MSQEITYSLNTVIEQLGTRVGNLEIALAQETAVKNAYIKRATELESELRGVLDQQEDSELNVLDHE